MLCKQSILDMLCSVCKNKLFYIFFERLIIIKIYSFGPWLFSARRISVIRKSAQVKDANTKESGGRESSIFIQSDMQYDCIVKV